MAITLQENISGGTSYSSGTFTNPLCITFDGIAGGDVRKHLLVTNDAGGAVDNLTINLTIPASHQGYLTTKFKLQESGDWADGPLAIGTLAGNSDASFWIQFSLTQDTSIQCIKDLVFKVSYT